MVRWFTNSLNLPQGSFGLLKSFEMHKKTVRTDQLLCIAEATICKVYTLESEAEAHGWVKALVLSLKQYHAHCYWLYKKGTTRAMVGLQQATLGWCLQMLQHFFQCGAKIILPLVFQVGGNTAMIATNLQEVCYRLAIVCDLCRLFPACPHKVFWNTTQGVRTGVLRNTQNKKEMKR